MADDVSPGPRPRYKTRSASISAPASTSMENVLMPNTVSGTGTAGAGAAGDGGTPGYRRRKPATRSQSARITGARSVSKFAKQWCYIIDTCLLFGYWIVCPLQSVYKRSV